MLRQQVLTARLLSDCLMFKKDNEKYRLMRLPAAARSLKIPFTYIVFRNCDILLCAQYTV